MPSIVNARAVFAFENKIYIGEKPLDYSYEEGPLFSGAGYVDAVQACTKHNAYSIEIMLSSVGASFNYAGSITLMSGAPSP
jgi:hypothetical protein